VRLQKTGILARLFNFEPLLILTTSLDIIWSDIIWVEMILGGHNYGHWKGAKNSNLITENSRFD
jgi:hypothetical protein